MKAGKDWLIDVPSVKDVEVLIITGDRDMYVDIDRCKQAVTQLKEGSELCIMHGGSHSLMWEKDYYVPFRERIMQFFNKQIQIFFKIFVPYLNLKKSSDNSWRIFIYATTKGVYLDNSLKFFDIKILLLIIIGVYLLQLLTKKSTFHTVQQYKKYFIGSFNQVWSLAFKGTINKSQPEIKLILK